MTEHRCGGIATDPETIALRAATEAFYAMDNHHDILAPAVAAAWRDMERAKARFLSHGMRMIHDAAYADEIRLRRREACVTGHPEAVAAPMLDTSSIEIAMSGALVVGAFVLLACICGVWQ